METTFRDQLLRCDECANEFVYTVGQQRMAYAEHGSVALPRFCPVCEVKIERMGRQRATPEERAETSLARTNGYHPHTGMNGYTNGAHRAVRMGTENGSESDDAPPVSPNRPPDYRSGEAHPLYGHGGELHTGSVKWFNDRKGFGFITLDDGVELFVHYSGIAGAGYKTLKQDQRVELVVEDTPKGPQASQVTVVEASPVVAEATAAS